MITCTYHSYLYKIVRGLNKAHRFRELREDQIIMELMKYFKTNLRTAVNNKDLKESLKICGMIGISTAQICRLAGIQHSNFSSYIKGRRNLKQKHIDKIFEVIEGVLLSEI